MLKRVGNLAVWIFLLTGFHVALAALPVTDPDTREASFMMPSGMPEEEGTVSRGQDEDDVEQGAESAEAPEDAIQEEEKEPVVKAPAVAPNKAEEKAIEQKEKPSGIEETTKPTAIEAPTPLIVQTATNTIAPQLPPPPPEETLALEKTEPVTLAAPVATAPIPDVSSDSFGLLSDQNGGLGAAMWKDTSRRMIDRLLPALTLPLASPALNDLARRFLLTVAAVPDDREQNGRPLPDLVSLRVEKLLMLGRVKDAWDLAALAPKGKVDQIALRQVIEAALVKNGDKNICAEIPGFVAAYGKGDGAATEWQKALVYCQLKEDGKKAAQLGLDVLHEQKVADDLFFDLTENNILRGKKKLPESLTPLRPMTFGLLRLIRAPLPSAVYAKAPAALYPELFMEPAADDRERLARAEQAAAEGKITADQLAAIYQSVSFDPKELAKTAAMIPQDVMKRAQLYQAAMAQEEGVRRMEIVQTFLGGVDDRDLVGGMGKLLAGLVENVPATNENSVFAPQAARLFALAGKPEQALAWLKMARSLAPRFAEVGMRVASRWPIFVLSGLEPDGDYAQGLKDWLYVALMPGKPEQNRARRDYAAQVLLILSAAGYAVPEDAWLRVAEAMPAVKGMVLSPFLSERLTLVSQGARKGETVLLSLLLADDGEDGVPFSAAIEIIRSLRRVGLDADAQAVAREATAALVMP